jgi:hypothetical protein
MSFFDLDPTASQNLMDQARMNPLDPGSLQPGWFAGAWKAPVTGLAAAVTDATLLAGDAAPAMLRPAARPIDQIFGTKLEDTVDKIPDYALQASQFTTPDPRTTGVVGQAVHGFFNIGAEALAGGPETAAVLQGYKSYRYGMADGLDPGTALGKGAIDGISTWVGLKLPMSVAPKFGVASTVATGAGGNIATGMATRGATAELLRERGYTDMAEQYQVMDSSAIAADLIMGGGFGALAHYGPAGYAKYQEWKAKNDGKLLPSDKATAAYLNAALHIELDTAPGIPTDPASRAAHTEAVSKAINDLMAGRDVEVDPSVTHANFEENPSATKTREEIVTAVEEHLGPEWQSLKIELDKRGLPSDDIDTTPTVKIVTKPVVVTSGKAEPAAIPSLQDFATTFKKTEGEQPVQALRDFEVKQQELLLGEVSKEMNGLAGVTVEALRTLGLANSTKEAMRLGLGRLVKAKDRGGMSADQIAERLHAGGWTPDESVESARAVLANVFAKKGQREPVVHSSMQDAYAELQKKANDAQAFEAHTSEQAGQRARRLGGDVDFATANPEAAHAYFDQFEKELARRQFEESGVGKLDEQTASIVAENPLMEIAAGDGSMSALDALVDADAEITKAQEDAQGYDAAVACALRG